MLGTELTKSDRDSTKAEASAELAEVYGGEGIENLRFRSKWYSAGIWPFRRISFECPGCSRWLSVSSSHSTRIGFCPSCDLTLAAPDVAKQLPPSLVSTAKEIPALPARRLLQAKAIPTLGGVGAVGQRSRSQPDPELKRPGSIEEEGDWGILENNGLVPVRVVTRLQSVKPWLGIAALLIAAALVCYGFMAMQTERENAQFPPVRNSQKRAKTPLSSELWVVLDALSTAGTPEELLSLVRNPTEVRAKVETYYAANEVDLPHRFERARPGLNVYQLGDKTFARFEGRCDGRPVKFSFEATRYGWRLDWESLVGYSDTSWSEFLAEKPQDEQQFRLLADVSTDELINYDREKYICFHLTDHLETGDGFALVERYGATASMLGKFLKLHARARGKLPRTWLTPVLRPLDGSDELLEMVGLKSASWLIP